MARANFIDLTMKSLVGLLFFLSLNAFAQQSDVFRIDSLPQKGILLDKNWKWHADDNPDFSKADFDDTKWESIDPTRPINAQKQMVEAEIGWLRLVLDVDSAVINRALCLYIEQTGASEVYLNGQLLSKLGTVSKDGTAEKVHWSSFSTPVYFTFSMAGSQVLAIRYSFSKANKLLPFNLNGNNKALRIRMAETAGVTEQITALVIHTTAYHWFLLGLFLTMAMLHFILYIYNRAKTINRIFAITLLLAAIHFFVGHLNHTTSDSLMAEYYKALYVVSIILYLNMLGYTTIKYLGQKATIPFWVLTFLFLGAGVLSLAFARSWVYYLYFGSCFLILGEVSRIIVKSKKTRHKDANVLLLSFISLFLLFLLRFLLLGGVVKIDFPHLPDYLMASFYVCTAATLSVLLAKNNALTEVALQKKLIENETLSAEKQHILATQNETLERQVAERTIALKASQAQLIQSEKLASLGELTAGIAHEIQNPLNFVNNFSEVSAELVAEMQDELDKGDTDEAKAIADDLKQNLQKITQHGKRASSIVKGMLEHSRASTGQREPTDLNALADEYLRLAYHGLRAKDSRFNSDFKTDFDENLPKVAVIPQDMGRVLLNLINNAFYAVKSVEKPLVVVKTEQTDNQVLIKISDNGTGMSEATQAKIFQPFFTTKPTGQGTGLGLSLAYDIVTKGHGGTLTMESVEGEGTEFVMRLPTKIS